MDLDQTRKAIALCTAMAAVVTDPQIRAGLLLLRQGLELQVISLELATIKRGAA